MGKIILLHESCADQSVDAVVNAAKVVLGNCAAGIEDVNSEANNNVVSRYNVNGMRINGAQKGLNIVKLANGKVVKMAVK